MLHYTKPPRHRRRRLSRTLAADLHFAPANGFGVEHLLPKRDSDCFLCFWFLFREAPITMWFPPPPATPPTSIATSPSRPLALAEEYEYEYQYEYLLKQFAFLNLGADQGDCDAINICSCPANNRLQTGILSVSLFAANVSVRSASEPTRSPASVLGIR